MPWAPQSSSPQAVVPTRMALLSTSSLTNKTFILNDIFHSSGLDFLFVMKTWLRAGEFRVFLELLPLDCSFLVLQGHLVEVEEYWLFLRNILSADSSTSSLFQL